MLYGNRFYGERQKTEISWFRLPGDAADSAGSVALHLRKLCSFVFKL